MERLAWFEVINQHGDVTARHPIYTWPVRVGRAYSNDIVLDDPFVAQHHLEIDSLATGDYQINDLGSINGLTLRKKRSKQPQATMSIDEVGGIGQTHFRIRPLGYAVAAEKKLPHHAWIWSWFGLTLGLLVLIAERTLVQWLNYDRQDAYNSLFLNIPDQTPWLIAWVGTWALLGRIYTGSTNWVQHATIATLGGGLYFLLDDLSGYVGFSLNSSIIEGVLLKYVSPMVLALLLYLHTRLVSRMSRRRLGATVVILMACSVGVSSLKENWLSETDLASMPYTRTIGPSQILLTQGKSTDEFLIDSNKLKPKVDE
jgi:uncharacterized membrane protein